MYKIIGADGNEYGPIPAEQVRQWVAEGRLNGLSKIQVDGSGEWKELREMAEFSTLVPPPPPPITLGAAPRPGYAGTLPPANPLAGWALGTGVGYWSTTRAVPLSVQLLPKGLSVGFSKRF